LAAIASLVVALSPGRTTSEKKADV